MRIAFAGASSTGKTTVAKRLLENEMFSNLIGDSKDLFLTIDARSILTSKKFSCLDNMTHNEKKHFQEIYLKEKIKKEKFKDNYLTDRSFVDLAAYWRENDPEVRTSGESGNYYKKCKLNVVRYDIHFYFPFGTIRFTPDGFRSFDLDYNKSIDKNIRYFLELWDINYVVMNELDIESRVHVVLNKMSQLG